MAEEYVKVEVSSSVLNPGGRSGNMKTFSKNLTVDQLKKKLQMIVGTEPKYMEICVREEGVDIAKLLDDTSTVGSCTALKDGMELFVVDKDPNNTISELQDTSKIEKYTMSSETYAKRDMNYQKWKNQSELSKAQEYKVGQKVDVLPDTAYPEKRRGTVMYVGELEGNTGAYLGIALDEPKGKHNGTNKGKSYFECTENHGIFVKPNRVEAVAE